jgi:phage-related holin
MHKRTVILPLVVLFLLVLFPVVHAQSNDLATAGQATRAPGAMDAVREFFVWLWSLDGVKMITLHTIVNVVVAVMAAIHVGELRLHKLAEFLYRKLLPYVIIYGVVKVIGVDAGLDWLAPAVFTIIEITLASDLAENLARLGIPMPEAVMKLVRKEV